VKSIAFGAKTSQQNAKIENLEHATVQLRDDGINRCPIACLSKLPCDKDKEVFIDQAENANPSCLAPIEKI